VASRNVVIRITKSTEGHEPLDVIRPDIKKLAPSKGSSPTPTVKFNGEAVLKFHEATQVGVILLLVRHDPSDGIVVIVELMLWRLSKKKKYQKRIIKKEGEIKKRRQFEWIKQADTDSLTQ